MEEAGAFLIDKQGFAWLPEDDFVNHFAADVDPVSVALPSMMRMRAQVRSSALMERRATAHSSCCEARTAPTGRIIAARCGKIPATSVRRLISLFSYLRGDGLSVFF